MNNGLSGIKNIIWALAIVVALAAVLVGLIITMVLGFGGQRQDGTMYLGEGSGLSSGGSDGTSSGSGGVDGGLDAGAGAMALPGSQDTGLEYLFNLTFLCDESFAAVGSFGANFGSTASAQVWLPAGGSLPAADAAGTRIIYPNDGTEKSPADAAGLYQPARLVIYLGGDSLGSADQASFIAGYSSLVKGIQAASPETRIICCSIGSVTAAYTGTDGLTASLVAQANQWIQQVCADTGVYYADLGAILNDTSGALSAEYAATDGRSISAAGISKIMDYFRMHGI
ncbi:MAG: SGNH/GDSL hydrolase family protein [Candidatus Limivicinus sp.]|nr:SGNH/GDSL hydrolase family protein [Candidatus Limivicinus sp.]